jgi:hypothetical protein
VHCFQPPHCVGVSGGCDAEQAWGGRVTSLGARRNPIGVRDRCGQAASDSPPNRQCFSIGDVRGAGLFVGTEFVGAGKAPHPAEALRVVNAMRECGVLISATGYSGNTI